MIDRSKLYLKAVKIDKAGLSELFKDMDIDFPPGARIPLFMLRASLKNGQVKGVYLADEKNKYGYAVYQYIKEEDLIHILYLAVLPRYRKHGLGSLLLEQLKEIGSGRIILDAEDPVKADSREQVKVCEKRIAFYEKNGYTLVSDFRFTNFGYYLRIMSNCQVSIIDWTKFYHRVYDNAYGVPISKFVIKEYKENA